MDTKQHFYRSGSTNCQGYVALPSYKEKPPIVLIATTWEGMNTFAKNEAHQLAENGYAAFIADIYGEGKSASSPEEAGALMMPFFLDRSLLRERILAAYHEAKKIPECAGDQIAAIGFCFGGLTVIELLRSGTALNGIVSFHGVLSNEFMGKKATLAPNATQYNSPFLLLHGYLDPLVPMSDVRALQKELSEKQLDWQMHIYGRASHAFTNPDANNPEMGLLFEPTSCRRSKTALYNYLKEIFHE